jgi:hypothetical protein
MYTWWLIRSTWARYKTLVNQARVLSFAEQILQYGFNNSQLEIDDRWESWWAQKDFFILLHIQYYHNYTFISYGDHQFDAGKFSDPSAMVNQLHNQVRINTTLFLLFSVLWKNQRAEIQISNTKMSWYTFPWQL